MRNPRQMSLFDALEPPAAPIPPPEPIAPAPARVKLSLDIGDTFLGVVTGDEFANVCLWQRVSEGIGDGIGPNDVYLTARFHDDPEGKLRRRYVRSVDIERESLEWAIELSLFAEAQSFFFHLTGNARPRRLTERDIRARATDIENRGVEKEPLAPEPKTSKPGPSADDVAYVEAAIQAIMPKSVPSYAKEILSVRITRGVRIVRVRLFDGEIGVLRLSGQPGAHGYAWDVGEVDKRPFHFDMDAWAWVRIDEDDD